MRLDSIHQEKIVIGVVKHVVFTLVRHNQSHYTTSWNYLNQITIILHRLQSFYKLGPVLPLVLCSLFPGCPTTQETLFVTDSLCPMFLVYLNKCSKMLNFIKLFFISISSNLQLPQSFDLISLTHPLVLLIQVCKYFLANLLLNLPWRQMITNWLQVKHVFTYTCPHSYSLYEQEFSYLSMSNMHLFINPCHLVFSLTLLLTAQWYVSPQRKLFQVFCCGNQCYSFPLSSYP